MELAKPLAIVPARGGSKGIPNKNRRLFLGRPLIEWTLRVALESGLCDRVVVSTDNAEISKIALACGAEVPFVRPEKYARDDTPTADVVRHVVDMLEDSEKYTPQQLLILEPTSPGRRKSHIKQTIELLSEPSVDSVASVVAVPHHYSPEKQLNIDDEGTAIGINGFHPREMTHRRQDISETYAFDGTIFSCTREVIKRNPPTVWGEVVKTFVVDNMYSIDLDELEQWIPSQEKIRSILL